MKCPYCSNSDTRVLDKRETEESNVTRRRRKCLKCKKRFTTYERVETLELTIVKKNGRRENFDRHKLLVGLLKACEKRSIPREKIENIVDDIEAKFRAHKKTEIDSRFIGELVMKKLKKLDKVAYIRFASVYREFADLDSFKREMEKLIKNK
ncbi:MAG: transcriptional repressor NrdR [Candidatus Aenigmatarchaeota archaeon]|nr:MAG: transcriptional repressor NrdR [Candidatus Aenigmarchaeota archaeon]